MNLLGLTTCVIGAINIFLAFLVFLRNPKRINNITYLFVAVAISIWVFSTYFYNNPIFFSPIWWLKIVYAASYMMLFTQMIFVYFFPRKINDNFYKYAIFIIISLLPSIYVLFFQDNVILNADYSPDTFRTIAEMGPGYIIYTIPNVLGIILLSIYFLRKGKNFVGYEKIQLNLYVVGSLIMMVPIVAMDYLIPLIWDYTELYVYGPFFVLPFTILVAYSILQNRFLDQRAMFGIVLQYVLRSLFFLPIFFLLAIFNVITVSNLYRPSFLILVIILTPIVLYFYSLYSRKIKSFINKVVLKQKQSYNEVVNDFTRKNSTELGLNQICTNTRESLFEAMKISKLSIILLNENEGSVVFEYLYNLDSQAVKDFSEIFHYWNELDMSEFLIADEIKRDIVFGDLNIDNRMERILRFMDKYRISAVLPLDEKTRLNGVLLIGYKPQETPISIEEIEFLDNIVTNTSVALGRGLLYKQVEDFNETLKQKVDIQTEELQQKVLELEEARRKEADMIDIMGHELRTPATIVKLNAQLLSQLYDKNDPVEFKKYVTRIQEGVEREIKLINTLLTSAKLEGDKIELDYDKVEIYPEVEISLHAHEKEAEEKGLKLINIVPKGLSSVYGDHARIVEIINNLVSNAIKYTDEGSIKINAFEEGNMVRVNIKDTGQGISKEDMQNLGKKFFRVQTYTGENDDIDVVRPGGTGLGLYVVFSLVEKMGGKLDVTSEVGRGSIFSFTLPKYSGQTITNVDGESHNMFDKLGLTKK